MQNSTVGSFSGHVIGCGGIFELGLAHVGGKSMHDFNRAAIVDTEVSGGAVKRELLVGAGFETAPRLDRSRTHHFGQVM